MNKNVVLLKTLLKSTSQLNIYRYTKEQRKRRKVVGNAIGFGLLYLMLMAYCIVMCVGYGAFGLIKAAPVMCALMISIIGFVFTLFKTNGYLFNFREYDMLMSLPFGTKTVAACKFLYMYIKSLPWYGSISVAMLIGYGIYARPQWYVYIIWLVLSLFLPVIPMLLASFIGFLIARVSIGFKKKNIIQTVITFAFVIFMFGLRFIVEDLFKNNKVEATLQNFSKVTEDAAGIYLPAGWFSDAVTKQSASGILFLVLASSLLFAGIFALVGRSYRQINSALKSQASAGKYTMTAQKQRHVAMAIAFKEFKRMTGSTVYMVNGAVGFLMAFLFGLITLIVGLDKIIAVVTQGAPLDTAILQPAIPFIIHFFIGMFATTVCSPSLEGKNFWIIQSLPIEMKTVYQGKMLFNMLLSVPFMLFSVLCLSISAKASAVSTVLYVLLGLCLCAFSTAWGCVCGVKHMRLDWENEVEVIKQGSAVFIYMFPNMFAVLGLVVLNVFLGARMNAALLTVLEILIVGTLAALCYFRVMKLSEKQIY